MVDGEDEEYIDDYLEELDPEVVDDDEDAGDMSPEFSNKKVESPPLEEPGVD